jgi:porphobilinogen synthase
MVPPPGRRPRRLRRTPAIRNLIGETELTASHLILPVFVTHGRAVARDVAAMPGVRHLSVDEKLDALVDRVRQAGLHALMLFGLPRDKDEIGSENFAPDGIVQQAVRRIRARAPELIVFTDVCCCAYTSHGHCGVVKNGEVDNDLTLEVLGKVAITHAEAGAHFVSPSGMMDGMVGAIRHSLDGAGHTGCGILSYAVKYASAFYGPFREAADSAPGFGDRRGYQMDPRNAREALREALQDEAEGADLLMVKPALAYLDVIRLVRERTSLPLVAYNVSGEYAMVKAAAANGWISEPAVVLEALSGMRRAGADAIITYHALDAATWLSETGP